MRYAIATSMSICGGKPSTIEAKIGKAIFSGGLGNSEALMASEYRYASVLIALHSFAGLPLAPKAGQNGI